MHMRMRIELQDRLCAYGLEGDGGAGYLAGMSILADNIRALVAPVKDQGEFAHLIGTTQSTVSRWIKGSEPMATNLAALARHAKCSIETLMTVPIDQWPAAQIDEVSEGVLIQMLEIAQNEIPSGTTFGDWPRHVASNLYAQFQRLRADRKKLDGPSVAPVTGVSKSPRSPSPKKSGALG